MCDLYPVFRSCCGVSVRIALIYIAILAIVTGALINAALKKAGVNIASIQDVKDFKKTLPFHAADNDTDEEMGFDAVGGALREEARAGDSYSDSDSDSDETSTTKKPVVRAPPKAKKSFLDQVSAVNKNGMNLLASGFVCVGVLLLIANFTKSPELAVVSVAGCVVLGVSALVLLVGVVGECTKTKKNCLLKELDWFTSFIVTLFWFMYVFCWLFFAGVANAFANGLY